MSEDRRALSDPQALPIGDAVIAAPVACDTLIVGGAVYVPGQANPHRLDRRPPDIDRFQWGFAWQVMLERVHEEGLGETVTLPGVGEPGCRGRSS